MKNVAFIYIYFRFRLENYGNNRDLKTAEPGSLNIMKLIRIIVQEHWELSQLLLLFLLTI